ncbi:MAG: nitroreductase family protein [Bacteroidota bacterium]
MTLTKAINYRRAVRNYDPDKHIDPNTVRKCIEQATLAPNSSNLQLWEFYHITSQNKLKKISKYCLDQPAAKTAKQMLVVVVRKDLWKKRVIANIENLKKAFGTKDPKDYNKKEKFAFQYYEKLVPITYFDLFGILGWIKYFSFWIIGLFKPIYRQSRGSDMRIVAHKSAGLAAQTFMLSMADVGYDTCPMEGIDTLRIKKRVNIKTWGQLFKFINLLT